MKKIWRNFLLNKKMIFTRSSNEKIRQENYQKHNFQPIKLCKIKTVYTLHFSIKARNSHLFLLYDKLFIYSMDKNEMRKVKMLKVSLNLLNMVFIKYKDAVVHEG